MAQQVFTDQLAQQIQVEGQAAPSGRLQQDPQIQETSQTETKLQQVPRENLYIDPSRFTYSGDKSGLQTFDQIKNSWMVKAQQQNTAQQKPKLLYINAPAGLFGKKVGNKKAIFSAAAEGASIGGTLGTVVPGVGNLIGSGIGAVVSTIGNLFKGDQRDWFDVVFKDAMKKKFKTAGLEITDRPYEGNLTKVSQFKIDTALTETQALQIAQAVAQAVSKKMRDQEIRQALAGLYVADQYDPKFTLFSFRVKQPQPTAQQQAQAEADPDAPGKKTAGPGQATKAGLTLAGIVALVLGAGFLRGS